MFARAFASTPSVPSRASVKTQRQTRRDPYALAQVRARKAANVSRQEVLKKERAATLGDPIRGVETPFLRSFDNPPVATEYKGVQDERLNFSLKKTDLEAGLEYSKRLISPRELRPGEETAEDYTSDETPESRQEKLEQKHRTAEVAMRRISSLSLGNSKDRLKVNVQRCIATFGRHTTDRVLSIKKAAASGSHDLTKTPRAGADTGSSEVQVAILTAKIRAIAPILETVGKMDKHNKRHLRLLVHRRQKLLKYLRRKERAGPRWQNLIETLGLTEGTWKGEITLGR